MFSAFTFNEYLSTDGHKINMSHVIEILLQYCLHLAYVLKHIHFQEGLKKKSPNLSTADSWNKTKVCWFYLYKISDGLNSLQNMLLCSIYR